MLKKTDFVVKTTVLKDSLNIAQEAAKTNPPLH